MRWDPVSLLFALAFNMCDILQRLHGPVLQEGALIRLYRVPARLASEWHGCERCGMLFACANTVIRRSRRFLRCCPSGVPQLASTGEWAVVGAYFAVLVALRIPSDSVLCACLVQPLSGDGITYITEKRK